ncbi:MAG: type IV toxin-antitoxin system AbiEi family antitoxin [Bacteroidota bacterium]|nr:type IV toxin-antitoxin system AbiEi family antitoxin [Bacteroidota bacterium]
MNILPEQTFTVSTIDRATYSLEQLIGQPVRLDHQHPNVPGSPLPGADGQLLIGPNAFLVDVKAALHLKTLGLLKASVRPGQLPRVVVSPYISPAIGQALQQQGVYYLDTVGNAYLQSADPALLILIQGRRPPAAERGETRRAFRRTGLRLLYHLLNRPELLQAPYRTLADEASLALGSVSAVLADLRQLGLLREEGDHRRWLDAPQVLRRWVEGYGETVRPKLLPHRYRWLDADTSRNGWQEVPLGTDSWWGGEPAAHLLLDGYLLPEYFTLYSTASRGELMRRFRLVPDESGKVEVLMPFETTSFQHRPQSRAVSPLLAYADLLLTTDPRNHEVAKLLHEQYLSHLA